MKVIVVKGKERETDKYPYIGVWPDGDLVLFTAPGTGIRLAYGEKHRGPQKIGSYSTDWYEGSVKPFSGTVTLSND